MSGWRANQLRYYLPPLQIWVTTLKVIASVHFVKTCIADTHFCSGYSMLPTLAVSWDLVLVSPLPYFRPWAATRSPRRGDLVFATSPSDPGYNVCKRVIGVAGDVVEVDPRRERDEREHEQEASAGLGGAVGGSGGNKDRRGTGWDQADNPYDEEIHTRDGIVRNNDLPLLMRGGGGGAGRRAGEFVKVPKGCVWLSGDNMSASRDSRSYGPVPIGVVKGKVVARIWPNPRLFSDESQTTHGTQA